jgi:hypothetical protein
MSGFRRGDTRAANVEARRLIWEGVRRFAIGSPAARRQATIDIDCILDSLAPITPAPAVGAVRVCNDCDGTIDPTTNACACPAEVES